MGQGEEGARCGRGEGGEGSTAPERKRKPKKGKDDGVKEEDERRG